MNNQVYEYQYKSQKRPNSREQRLRDQIQSTLKSLSKKIDLTIEQNGNKSPGGNRSRPDRPNRFWVNNNTIKKMQPKDIQDYYEPRPTDFPELDNFLKQSPDDQNLFDLTPTPDRLKSIQESSALLYTNLTPIQSENNLQKEYNKAFGQLDFSQQREIKDQHDLDKLRAINTELSRKFDQNSNQIVEQNQQSFTPPTPPFWNEEDMNKDVPIIMSLDQNQEEDMEFDEEDEFEEDQNEQIFNNNMKQDKLMVDLNNLLENSSKKDKNSFSFKQEFNNKNITNDKTDRPTIKSPEYEQLKIKRKKFNPQQQNQGTLRASYKSGNEFYNLYGIPAVQPGDKGQIFLQSTTGFAKDLPPVRLSIDQRDQLVENFQQLQQITEGSQRDDSEEEIPDDGGSIQIYFDEKNQKNQILNNIYYDSQKTPSRDKHYRVMATNNEILRDNKTFWSSGVEKKIIPPNNTPGLLQLGKIPQQQYNQNQQGNDFNQKFQDLFNTTRFPSKNEQIQMIRKSIRINGNLPPPDSLEYKKQGFSFLNIIYNGMSSILGGFGKMDDGQEYYENHNSQNQDEKINYENNQIIEQKYYAPNVYLNTNDQEQQQYKQINQRPNHDRFKRNSPIANQQVSELTNSRALSRDPSPQQSTQLRISYQQNDPFKKNEISDQLKQQFESSGLKITNDQSSKSVMTFRSLSQKSDEHQKSNQNFENNLSLKKQNINQVNSNSDFMQNFDKIFNNIENSQDESLEKSQSKDIQFPINQYKQEGEVYKNNDQSVKKSNDSQTKNITQPVEIQYSYKGPEKEIKKSYQLQSQYQQIADPIDLNLPNVILLVADHVKLIRNNSVPMLQVQLEIIPNALSQDNDMCMLGLNDVIYIVPEYSPTEYDFIYSHMCTGNEQQENQGFFEHYANFTYNPDPKVDNIPERMVGLYKNCMTAIERDHYEPDLRGKAFINLKNVPNGYYTIFYIRIGQPISINSRLKVLGRSKGIYVNINRDKISQCKKPQLDLNHSSSRISKQETSKFKIIKAKQNKKRDNKVMSLNSEDEPESEEEQISVEQEIVKELKKIEEIRKSQIEKSQIKLDTNASQKENFGDMEMEFEQTQETKNQDLQKTNKSKNVVKPPPLQDSKEYYNSTQRMTEAMIQNPQFQIFSIDEEDSVRSSIRENTRQSEHENIKKFDQNYNNYNGQNNFNQQFQQFNQHTLSQLADSFNNLQNLSDFNTNNIEQKYEPPIVQENNLKKRRDSSPLEPLTTPFSENNESLDPISKQIEEYQKQSLAQIANLQAFSNQNQQYNQKILSPQRSESRQSRSSSKVKTISLKDLEYGNQKNENQIYEFRQQVENQQNSRSQSQAQLQQQYMERDTVIDQYQPFKMNSKSQIQVNQQPLNPNIIPNFYNNQIQEYQGIIPFKQSQANINETLQEMRDTIQQNYFLNNENQRFEMNQQIQNIQNLQTQYSNPTLENQRPQSASRPWKGDRGNSQQRRQSLSQGRSNQDQEMQNIPQSAQFFQAQPAILLQNQNIISNKKYQSPQQNEQRPRSAAQRSPYQDTMNAQQNLRPTSASQLKNSGSRNRFFSQRKQSRENQANNQNSQQINIQNQKLSAGGKSQGRFSGENFSDENSPARPMGMFDMQNSVPIRQWNNGLKSRFGEQLQGKVPQSGFRMMQSINNNGKKSSNLLIQQKNNQYSNVQNDRKPRF